MAIRIKTTWFKQVEGPKDLRQQAGVVASTIWKQADKTVTDLSKANFSIETPQRGFGLLAELSVFMLHLSDRIVYLRMNDADRQTLVQALAVRLAEILEENIHEVVNDHGHPYQADFIDLVNRRCDDYASFDFPATQPDFSVLRYLGNRICEIMDERDRAWIIDQVMELSAPDMVGTVEKVIDGLFPKTA